MKVMDIKKLEPDPITKARAEVGGESVTVSGFIRSVNTETITICASQMSQSYLECPQTAIFAAFEEETNKVTLLIARDANVRIVKQRQAHELINGDLCGGCNYPDVDVAEARPWKSIHPELAKFKAEMQKIKDSIGTGPGARFLKCEQSYHDSIIAGKDVDDANFTRDLCLMGIDEDQAPNLLW